MYNSINIVLFIENFSFVAKIPIAYLSCNQNEKINQFTFKITRLWNNKHF
ncbi:hypothetical protein KORDIASMS9_01998 [Kordia sp. SMS9]|nr:hypothetical protein KORDIASMS9_01998 [Kordia sp. SMS9]